ncbi:hypothetical protein K461DRAFT_274664 [Myriangium duriaei CBS 260.36]|uniref:UBA domain-containing protein n=1 Tax=Myriangium duriaei CBS 260.36 TaxID=1168546 RepID=A0A9P4J6K4_9PEZI|nr:hypothetical protein K461DRAFT_274664 [Myriangium duriaei CBS 260.36]
MASPSNDYPSPGLEPGRALAYINTRRSLSIFSRRGSTKSEIMPRHLTSLLGHTFGNSKSNATRQNSDRRRLEIRVIGLQDQQAMEPGCSTAPLAVGYEQLRDQKSSHTKQRSLDSVQSPSSHQPLSAAALERTMPNNVDALKEISRTRVGAWVEGVVNSDMAFHVNTVEPLPLQDAQYISLPLSPSFGAGDRSRSPRPNLSVVIPKARQQKPRVTTKNTTAAPPKPIARINTKHQHSCASSTTSAEQSSLKSDGSKTDGSSYSKKSSRTSIDSTAPALKIEAIERSAEASKYRLTTFDPKSAGVFDVPSKMNLNKPLPSAPEHGPGRIDSQRSYASLPEARGAQAKLENPSRPGSAQSWRPILVRTSHSCRSLQKLDMFDNEFMKTYQYNPSNEGDAPSSPADSYASEQQDKVGQIMPLPLQIRRILKRNMSSESSIVTVAQSTPTEQPNTRISEEDSVVPTISVTRAVSPPLAKKTPPPPPRSLRRDTRSEIDATPAPLAVDRSMSGKASTDRFCSNADTGKIVHTELDLHLAPQMPLPTPATPSARLSILTPAVDDVPATAATLTAHEELWPPRSPMKFQTARSVAETALLRIMSSLSSIDDLTNTSIINKGMRRVYQENELSLLTAVLANESPAAWELREWTTPPNLESSASDPDSCPVAYTATSYKNHTLRDRAVIEKLKPMIASRCSGFLRSETVSALSSASDANSARFNEALYRIWCFCVIFGSGKRREDDMNGQLDWLKGGLLANQQGCAATVTTSLDFDFNSVLLNPPEHFGQCNRNRLSSDDLYDMMEMWNCLAALLQTYVGKTSQARIHGVFDSCRIKRGDIEAEAVALEEWMCHILSLGPAAVLKLAEMAEDTNAGFALAAINGWMKWTPPAANGTRSPFLREPVCRLYEQRISEVGNPSSLSPEEQERKVVSRNRVAMLGAEIRAARAASSYKRLPFIDMASERPMSTLTRRSVSNASSATLMAASITSSPTVCAASPAPSAMTNTSWLFSQPKHCGNWPIRTVSPVAEELRKQTPSPDSQKSIQRPGHTAARQPRTISTEKAVMGVVSMGFTPAQAREALLFTHDADGHHVDRAVDWLLRQS